MRRDDEYVGKDLCGREQKERKTEAEVDGHIGQYICGLEGEGTVAWRRCKTRLCQEATCQIH